MQIKLRHMSAIDCWETIIDMHSDYHQNLKQHKYTYNQFVPNDKRMHEFMEIENPTAQQVKPQLSAHWESCSGWLGRGR